MILWSTSSVTMLLSALLSSQECPYAPEDFIGSWSTDAGEEIVVDDQRVFEFALKNGSSVWSEWLHHRPMGDGEWQLADCGVIILTSRHDGFEYERLRMLNANQLISDDGMRTLYNRVSIELEEATE